ncbi:MAG: cytochrome-c peroxidase [Cyclobacteriaceae bacterium]|nr:cytochrome-c peroxidase [Cyclobacteriaceae bacterium]
MKGYSFTLLLLLMVMGCDNTDPDPVIRPTPYEIEYPFTINKYLPPMIIPEDNPMTVEGVALGRKLFYEKKLSGDGTMSCASCHMPDVSFADSSKFSVGIDGIEGKRNSPNIVNAGWMNDLFWDGRAESIETQALAPVTNPIEMHSTWIDVSQKLMLDEEYVSLFNAAFGTIIIDSMLVVKAIAQFERTLISGNAPFDKFLANEPMNWSTEDFAAAYNGFMIFMDETKGDCFHCHGDETNPLWTDNLFHNNGLDAVFTDLGQGEITHNPSDNGKFKTPTLRNLLFTAPYMHDGRFNTLEEVVEHYSTGLKNSPTIDPLMKKVDQGGINLSAVEKANLVMFLKSLTDSSFVVNPNFQNPNQ